MKIKRERKVRLDELLKIVWSNPTKYESAVFESHRKVIPVEVQISNDGLGVRFLDGKGVGKSDLFTVTEEVEITEETKIPLIVAMNRNTVDRYADWSIQDLLDRDKKFGIDYKNVYILNDNGSIGELVWSKECGLDV